MKLQPRVSLNNYGYEEVINQIVDETLNKVFGPAGAMLIYSYLKDSHAIKRNEIALKLDSFTKALRKYLNSGASVVEQKILEGIYSFPNQSNLEEQTNDRDFAEQVRRLMFLDL